MMNWREFASKLNKAYWKGMVALSLPLLSLAEDDVLAQGLSETDKNITKGMSITVKVILWLWLALLIGSIIFGIANGIKDMKKAEAQNQGKWGAFAKGLAIPVGTVWGLSVFFAYLLSLIHINVIDAFEQLFQQALNGG